MADALGSGPSPGNRVEVQVLSSALSQKGVRGPWIANPFFPAHWNVRPANSFERIGRRFLEKRRSLGLRLSL
jgi:hypothetical protein